MTDKEIIAEILNMKKFNYTLADNEVFDKAIQGIKVLSAIEDIKAEIHEEKGCAYADFERYKVEYLGQDWEDALDSLPQDDFRYGMERCLEIIQRRLKNDKRTKDRNVN